MMNTAAAERSEPASPSPAAGRLTARSRSDWRRGAKWLFAALLVVDVGILLFVLAFANVTAQGPATRALGHSVAILTEVDAFLDDHFETLRQEAAQTQEETVAVSGFPLDVSFPREEISSASREEFRALLLSRSAELIHEDGASAFAADRESDIGFFSPEGVVTNAMDFLRPRPHDILTVLTIIFAATAGILSLGLILTSRGYGGVLGVGLSVLVAAVLFLLLAVAMRFVFRTAADGVDDYLARELFTLAQELTWAPIRNGIIFSVGGAAVFLAGSALARWGDRRRPA